MLRAEKALNGSASPARGYLLAESYLALAEAQSRLGVSCDERRKGQDWNGGRLSVERRDTLMPGNWREPSSLLRNARCT